MNGHKTPAVIVCQVVPQPSTSDQILFISQMTTPWSVAAPGCRCNSISCASCASHYVSQRSPICHWVIKLAALLDAGPGSDHGRSFRQHLYGQSKAFSMPSFELSILAAQGAHLQHGAGRAGAAGFHSIAAHGPPLGAPRWSIRRVPRRPRRAGLGAVVEALLTGHHGLQAIASSVRAPHGAGP